MQVMGRWDSLQAHIRAWAQKRGVSAELSKGVIQRFKGRMKTHYAPYWAAAELIDPIHFTWVGEGMHV